MSGADIQQQLRETCVLIAQDGSFGSGFLVARGFAATAAHVVLQWPDGEWFEVLVGWGPERRKVRAKVYDRNKNADAAVLKVEGCDDIDPIPVGLRASAHAAWSGFGFPQVASLRGEATGVPLGGTIIDAGYSNIHTTPQMAVYSDEAKTCADMSGVSGSAVTVDGAVVGHIVEQFRDPGNLDRSILGQLKACPIHAILALLPQKFGYRKVQASAPQADVSIPELVSWCDREAVTSRVNDWLDAKAGGARLMCLVGHSDNRQALLLDRIAQELSEQKPNRVASNAVHIHHEVEPGNANQFRRVVLGSLNVERDDRVQHSSKFRGATGLVLLCQYCNCPKGSPKEIERRILQAATWLEGLSLGRRRLLLVLTIRFEELSLTDEVAGKVREAVSAVKSAHQPLEAIILGEPLTLEDYQIQHVRNWIALPHVKKALGRTAAEIEGDTLRRWFEKETLNHGKLLGLLAHFHHFHQLDDR